MTNKTSDYDLTVIVPVYNERGNMLRLETALSAFLIKSPLPSCDPSFTNKIQDFTFDFFRKADKAVSSRNIFPLSLYTGTITVRS